MKYKSVIAKKTNEPVKNALDFPPIESIVDK